MGRVSGGMCGVEEMRNDVNYERGVPRGFQGSKLPTVRHWQCSVSLSTVGPAVATLSWGCHQKALFWHSKPSGPPRAWLGFAWLNGVCKRGQLSGLFRGWLVCFLVTGTPRLAQLCRPIFLSRSQTGVLSEPPNNRLGRMR